MADKEKTFDELAAEALDEAPTSTFDQLADDALAAADEPTFDQLADDAFATDAGRNLAKRRWGVKEEALKRMARNAGLSTTEAAIAGWKGDQTRLSGVQQAARKADAFATQTPPTPDTQTYKTGMWPFSEETEIGMKVPRAADIRQGVEQATAFPPDMPLAQYVERTTGAQTPAPPEYAQQLYEAQQQREGVTPSSEAANKYKRLVYSGLAGKAPTPEGYVRPEGLWDVLPGAPKTTVDEAAALLGAELSMNPPPDERRRITIRIAETFGKDPDVLQQEAESSAAQAFGASALRQTVPAMTALAVGTRTYQALAPKAGGSPLGQGAALVTSVLSGMGASILTNLGQDEVMPEEVENALNLVRQEHPWASMAGELAPGMTAVRPSVRNFARAARTLFDKGVRSPQEMSNVFNVGLGAAIQGGTEAGRQAKEYGLDLDKWDTWRIAMETGLGALQSEPTRFGKSQFGFKSDWDIKPQLVSEPGVENVQIPDFIEAANARALDDAYAKSNVLPASESVEIAAQPTAQPMIGTMKHTILSPGRPRLEGALADTAPTARIGEARLADRARVIAGAVPERAPLQPGVAPDEMALPPVGSDVGLAAPDMPDGMATARVVRIEYPKSRVVGRGANRRTVGTGRPKFVVIRTDDGSVHRVSQSDLKAPPARPVGVPGEAPAARPTGEQPTPELLPPTYEAQRSPEMEKAAAGQRYWAHQYAGEVPSPMRGELLVADNGVPYGKLDAAGPLKDSQGRRYRPIDESWLAGRVAQVMGSPENAPVGRIITPEHLARGVLKNADVNLLRTGLFDSLGRRIRRANEVDMASGIVASIKRNRGPRNKPPTADFLGLQQVYDTAVHYAKRISSKLGWTQAMQRLLGKVDKGQLDGLWDEARAYVNGETALVKRQRDEIARLRDAVNVLSDQRNQAQRALEVDALTGLGNKAAFLRALPAVEASADTFVLALDANNFGKVNKLIEHGEPVGDAELIKMGRALKQAASEHGLGERTFRQGGDEFAVLGDYETLIKVAQRARELYGKQHFKGTLADGTKTTTVVEFIGGIGKTLQRAAVEAQRNKTAVKAGKPVEFENFYESVQRPTKQSISAFRKAQTFGPSIPEDMAKLYDRLQYATEQLVKTNVNIFSEFDLHTIKKRDPKFLAYIAEKLNLPLDDKLIRRVLERGNVDESGPTMGGGLGGLQRFWSPAALALEELKDKIKLSQVLPWLRHTAQRLGISVTSTELDALELDKLIALHGPSATLSKEDLRLWIADRVLRTRVVEARNWENRPTRQSDVGVNEWLNASYELDENYSAKIGNWFARDLAEEMDRGYNKKPSTDVVAAQETSAAPFLGKISEEISDRMGGDDPISNPGRITPDEAGLFVAGNIPLADFEQIELLYEKDKYVERLVNRAITYGINTIKESYPNVAKKMANSIELKKLLMDFAYEKIDLVLRSPAHKEAELRYADMPHVWLPDPINQREIVIYPETHIPKEGVFTHFEENALAHMRTTDRWIAGDQNITDKILFSEEFQSDWNTQKLKWNKLGPQRERFNGLKTELKDMFVPILQELVNKAGFDLGTYKSFSTNEEQTQSIFAIVDRLANDLLWHYDKRVPIPIRAERLLVAQTTNSRSSTFASIQERQLFEKLVKPLETRIREIQDEAEPILQRIHSIPEKEPPTHPLLPEWKELLVKRLLHTAAHEDYDGIGWTTGAQQRTRNGHDESSKWEGDLYDRQVVDIVNSFAKRFGQKVETRELFDLQAGLKRYMPSDTPEGRRQAKEIHYLHMTPEMRQAILAEGLPTFGWAYKAQLAEAIADLHRTWADMGKSLGMLGTGGLQTVYEKIAPIGRLAVKALWATGKRTYDDWLTTVRAALPDDLRARLSGKWFKTLYHSADVVSARTPDEHTPIGVHPLGENDDVAYYGYEDGNHTYTLKGQVGPHPPGTRVTTNFLRQAGIEAATPTPPALSEPHRGYGRANRIVTADDAEDAARNIKRVLSSINAGVPLSAAADFIKIAIYHAEALWRDHASDVPPDKQRWMQRMLESLDVFGYRATPEQLDELWNAPHVQMFVKHVVNVTPGTQRHNVETQPQSRGRLGAFMRETVVQTPQGTLVNAPWLGAKVFFKEFRSLGRQMLIERAVALDTLKRFGRRWRDALTGRMLSNAEHEAFYKLSQMVGRDKDGNRVFGGQIRAGDVDVRPGTPVGKMAAERNTNPIGLRLDDGRWVVGPVMHGDKPSKSHHMTIWEVTPQEARAYYDQVAREYPRALRLFETYDSWTEPPTIMWGNTMVPAFSRHVLKRQYEVAGMDEAQAQANVDALTQALGPSHNIKPYFHYVPENVILHPRSADAHQRNLLRLMTVGLRRRKTGAGAYAVRQEGHNARVRLAIQKARTALGKEFEHNRMAADIIASVAVPVDAELVASGKFKRLDTVLYGQSTKFLTFVQRNAKHWERMGIDIAAGSHMIPERLVAEFAPTFTSPGKSIDDKFQRSMDILETSLATTIELVHKGLLYSFASGAKNLIAVQINAMAKVMRDIALLMNKSIEDVAKGRGYNMAHARAVWSDVKPSTWLKAVADTFLETFYQDPKWTPPAEFLGSTYYRELGASSTTSEVSGFPLRFLFQPADIYGKKLIYEMTADAGARDAWAEAVKQGRTLGMSKKEFIRLWKEHIPPEIQEHAWRESDAFGAPDYSNVPGRPKGQSGKRFSPSLRALRESKIGQAIFPFPVWIYKQVWNTYGEFYGSFARLARSHNNPNIDKATELSNAMVATLMTTVLYQVLDAWGPWKDKPEGVKERDLQMSAQQTGRVQVLGATDEPWAIRRFVFGSDADKAWWLRVADWPFVGPMSYIHSAVNGDWSPEDIPQMVNEMIGIGPLVMTAATLYGLMNTYNKDKSYGERVGQSVTQLVPGKSLLYALRATVDPMRRDVSTFGDSESDVFVKTLMENTPWLSMMLPVSMSKSLKAPMAYPENQKAVSWFMLNLKPIDEYERKWAIQMAKINNIKKQKAQVDEDLLRKLVSELYDTQRAMYMATDTASTAKMRMAKALDENDRKRMEGALTAGVLIERAFINGGYGAATTTFDSMMANERDPVVKAELASKGPRLLVRLKMLSDFGMAYPEWTKLPAAQQAEYLNLMQAETDMWRKKHNLPPFNVTVRDNAGGTFDAKASTMADLVSRIADEQGIDPQLAMLMVKKESGFDPSATSPKGARGLLQLMPDTAAELGVSDVTDPEQNIRGGLKYLRQLLEQYDGDLEKALAAYNAGPGAVDKYGGVPPYAETQDYVGTILGEYYGVEQGDGDNSGNE